MKCPRSLHKLFFKHRPENSGFPSVLSALKAYFVHRDRVLLLLVSQYLKNKAVTGLKIALNHRDLIRNDKLSKTSGVPASQRP